MLFRSVNLRCYSECKSPFGLMTDRTDDIKRGTQHVTLTRRGESAYIEKGPGIIIICHVSEWNDSNNWEKSCDLTLNMD